MHKRTFKYRLYPTASQEASLDACLRECRWLYNHLLEMRKTAYETNGETLRLYDQINTYKELKELRPSLRNVHSQVLQNVAVRLDLGMKAFFRRVKSGQTAEGSNLRRPGYPRFRGRDRYDSFTYPQAPGGCKLEGSTARCAAHRTATLSLSKIGQVKVKLHRPLEGTPKTCAIKRDSTGKWWATFSCEVEEPQPLPVSKEIVGIDVGLKDFAFLSTDEAVPVPKFFRRGESELAKVQHKLSKQEKGTPQRRSGTMCGTSSHKRKKIVSQVHAKIASRRRNFTDQLSRKIVNRFQLIAVEDIHTNRMVHNHCLAKSIYDAAWSPGALWAF